MVRKRPHLLDELIDGCCETPPRPRRRATSVLYQRKLTPAQSRFAKLETCVCALLGLELSKRLAHLL
jgi:hypothetical protein